MAEVDEVAGPAGAVGLAPSTACSSALTASFSTPGSSWISSESAQARGRGCSTMWALQCARLRQVDRAPEILDAVEQQADFAVKLPAIEEGATEVTSVGCLVG